MNSYSQSLWHHALASGKCSHDQHGQLVISFDLSLDSGLILKMLKSILKEPVGKTIRTTKLVTKLGVKLRTSWLHSKPAPPSLPHIMITVLSPAGKPVCLCSYFRQCSHWFRSWLSNIIRSTIFCHKSPGFFQIFLKQLVMLCWRRLLTYWYMAMAWKF